MGLQSLCRDRTGSHIHLRSENITAVASKDCCGSTKPNLYALTVQIYEWAASRNITLSADMKSRVNRLDGEWMLLPEIFNRICQVFYTPAIDLFATRLIAQLPAYVF